MTIDGEVTIVGQGYKYKVRIDGFNKEVKAVLSGRLKYKKISIEVGDRVKLKPAQGIYVIVFRYK